MKGLDIVLCSIKIYLLNIGIFMNEINYYFSKNNYFFIISTTHLLQKRMVGKYKQDQKVVNHSKINYGSLCLKGYLSVLRRLTSILLPFSYFYKSL